MDAPWGGGGLHTKICSERLYSLCKRPVYFRNMLERPNIIINVVVAVVLETRMLNGDGT